MNLWRQGVCVVVLSSHVCLFCSFYPDSAFYPDRVCVLSSCIHMYSMFVLFFLPNGGGNHPCWFFVLERYRFCLGYFFYTWYDDVISCTDLWNRSTTKSWQKWSTLRTLISALKRGFLVFLSYVSFLRFFLMFLSHVSFLSFFMRKSRARNSQLPINGVESVTARTASVYLLSYIYTTAVPTLNAVSQ